jgi:hypothetical protein
VRTAAAWAAARTGDEDARAAARTGRLHLRLLLYDVALCRDPVLLERARSTRGEGGRAVGRRAGSASVRGEVSRGEASGFAVGPD